jgi:hypothetical protein
MPHVAEAIYVPVVHAKSSGNKHCVVKFEVSGTIFPGPLDIFDCDGAPIPPTARSNRETRPEPGRCGPEPEWPSFRQKGQTATYARARPRRVLSFYPNFHSKHEMSGVPKVLSRFWGDSSTTRRNPYGKGGSAPRPCRWHTYMPTAKAHPRHEIVAPNSISSLSPRR